MTDAQPLHLAIDVRAGRTVLATVQGGRVIDMRRREHGVQPDAAQLAADVAVLVERAPGEVRGLAGVWRHGQRLGTADPGDFAALIAAIGQHAALPTSWLPSGAALALGEWQRVPCHGPLGVFALDVGMAGGVVIAGQAFAPLRLDLGHLNVDVNGLKCACGGRGCLHAYASETALQELSRDFEMSLEQPSAIDRQTIMSAHLAEMQRAGIGPTHVLTDRAGWAIGVAAARLQEAFGVVEVRVRTRHPELWQVLAPSAEAAVRQICGPRAPQFTPADPGEDGFFVGAVAAAR